MEQNNKSTGLKTLMLLIASLLFVSLGAQDAGHDEFETFNYEDGDSVYVMQKYFLVFLKRGPNRDFDKETSARIQNEHLAYLGDLYKKGVICMNGPFGDDGDVRGATVYRVPTLEEAKKLASGDPAVKAGRLAIEVHPWWLARGTGVH